MGAQYPRAHGGTQRHRQEIDLLVDVQYAFPDADTALDVLADWQLDLVFVETPLWPDDLDGYRRCPKSSRYRSPPASG